MDGLTPGRIVHYAARRSGNLGPRCLAAIVTQVYIPTAANDGHVALHVFDADGEGGSGREACYSDVDRTPGTWHWPERA